jgi:glycosyltransferase involved in cell wall biosynthesis
MMRLGIVVSDDSWHFFREILDDLKSKYAIEVFQRRTVDLPFFYERANRRLFRHDFEAFIQRNDVVFFEWASDLLMYATLLPRRSHIITRLHSYELFEWAPRINWGAVDRIILVSHAMQRAFLERYPDQSQKASVVYNGVTLDKFCPPEQSDFNNRLGMLCDVVPIKRVYEVVLLAYELKQRGSSASLHIAGKTDNDPRYVAAIQGLVRKLGLQNDVFLDGFITDTNAWLRDTDIFVSNSYWEGQQVALIEAMASSCYCLSHIWDGAEEVLPPENLFITDTEMLERVVNYFKLPAVTKQEKRLQMYAIACEKFDIRNTTVSIRKIIEETAMLIHRSTVPDQPPHIVNRPKT